MPRAGVFRPSDRADDVDGARGTKAHAVTRRIVLGVVSAAALAGCTREQPEQAPKPRPDVEALLHAIAGEEQLIALYESTRASHQELTDLVDPLLAHHREHLEVLRHHYQPGTGSGPSAPVPSTPAPTAPASTRSPSSPQPAGASPLSGRRQAVAALRAAERASAAARTADVARVAPGMAQLFASIGACEAGHAAWLMRVP